VLNYYSLFTEATQQQLIRKWQCIYFIVVAAVAVAVAEELRRQWRNIYFYLGVNILDILITHVFYGLLIHLFAVQKYTPKFSIPSLSLVYSRFYKGIWLKNDIKMTVFYHQKAPLLITASVFAIVSWNIYSFPTPSYALIHFACKNYVFIHICVRKK